MTLRIETIRSADCTNIRLIGRLRAEGLQELRAHLEAAGRNVLLEMDEVTLVDLETVRFLGAYAAQGVQIRCYSAYIREWSAQERERNIRHWQTAAQEKSFPL